MYANLKKNLSNYHQRVAETTNESELMIKVLERLGSKVIMITQAQGKKNFSEVQKHLDHFNDLTNALWAGLQPAGEINDKTSQALAEYLTRMKGAVSRLIVSKSEEEGKRIAVSFSRIVEVIKAQIKKERSHLEKKEELPQMSSDSNLLPNQNVMPYDDSHIRAEKINFSA